jgi:Predicted ATPase
VPEFKPERAIQTASHVPIEITPDWLKARSPVPVGCSIEKFLESIFKAHEQVLIFNRYKSQGCLLFHPGVSLKSFIRQHWSDGAWFLCNPVDGQSHWNPRQQKNSRRSEESVTSFRYAVLECDQKPKEKWFPIWLKILVQQPLQIVSITDSAGKSIHALVRVSASSKIDWDAIKIRNLRPSLVPLGADDGALSAVRLTRLPGAYRCEQRQELLYPDPSGGRHADYRKVPMNPLDDIKAIITEFGPPGYENDKGKFSKLNEPFWAAYYARQQTKIIFEPNEREFYDYDPATGIFVPKSSDRIRTELSALVMEAAHAWSGFLAMEQFRSAQILAGVLAHLRGQIEERNFFNQSFHLVHLGNCVLRFEPDGSKFRAESFSPLHHSRNRSPLSYDPKATCPNFEKFIRGHIEEDDRLLLQKYAGQCLLGRNLTQRFVVFDGEGAASKGAFVLIVRGVVGPANAYELRTNHLGERFEIGRTVGKTLLLGADVRANFMAGPGASRLKALVGGDMLEAERKGSNQTIYVDGNFNILITSNSRLRVNLEGDQSAWRRRITIARADKPFPGKKIPEIHERLLNAEGAGILNWLLDGLKKLLRDISEHGDIALSQRQKDRVESLLLESDSLRIFVKQNVSRFNGSDLTVSELVEKYMKFCADSGWSPIPVAIVHRQLDDILLELFAVSKSNSIGRNGTAVRGYRNLKFRSPTDEDPS